MNNREMEKKIRQALEHAAPAGPEKLSELLSRCDHQEGEPIMEQEKTKRVIPLWVRLATAAAAVLVIGGGCLGGTLYYQRNLAVDSEIVLDVNPSIEIRLNAKEKVREVTAQNEDAVQILDGMDLKGTDLKVAVNALLGSLVKHGYIDDLANSILVTVENDDSQRGEQLQIEIVEEINRILSAQSIDGAVLSQNLPKTASDDTLQAMADKYGISMGKASLIQTLTTANPLLSEEGLAALSINELNLLLEAQDNTQQDAIQSVGTASDKAYIGEQAALQAALSHAGVAESDVTQQRIKLDFDDGAVEYDVDFYTIDREYEYEIHATTGAVLSYETGLIGSARPDGSGGVQVSLEEAKQAALTHAGVSADSVAFTKTEQDTDDGRTVYELEFQDSASRYDYIVDAGTGTVLSYKIKAISGSSTSTQPSSDAAVSLEEAKQAALTHAGISADSVTFKKTEQDRDDGRTVYEIEFYTSSRGYDYTIDAATGTVLSYQYEDIGGGDSNGGTGISEAEARSIAQNRAPGAQIISCELDRDDGQMIYEIELRDGQTEYDCEIRQSDGAVIKWEQDIDD